MCVRLSFRNIFICIFSLSNALDQRWNRWWWWRWRGSVRKGVASIVRWFIRWANLTMYEILLSDFQLHLPPLLLSIFAFCNFIAAANVYMENIWKFSQSPVDVSGTITTTTRRLFSLEVSVCMFPILPPFLLHYIVVYRCMRRHLCVVEKSKNFCLGIIWWWWLRFVLWRWAFVSILI